MGLLTTFFNLFKPAKTDPLAVARINENFDTIDTEMHRPPLTVNGISPDATTRDVYVEEVPLATNLSSDIAQLNTGTFVERTSGGDASIEDGQASLVLIKGNMVHTGYVAEVLNMTVTPAERPEPEEGEPDTTITATIDRDTFVAYVQVSSVITLTYTSAWSADPLLYGITVTGTPINGDVITVNYTKEDRGTITTATPTTFNSTGWNLYNNTVGYARVVDYSDMYGYFLGGTYSLIEFATAVGGTREAVVVTDGYFTVPSDGYVYITGGDDTTYIYPTWSNWIDGYQGDFETYTVDTVDLSEAMLNFPAGLLAVGNVRDEININAQTAINRVERLAYTAENLASVIASGVDYVADTNYIYAVLETPVTTSISIDGTYTVSDHGIEFYTGTTVAVLTETLYGENLKDKLRTDVVTISEQTLSSTQQAQVRNNISAASQSDVATLNSNIATLEKHTWGSAQTFTTTITCPSDGYIVVAKADNTNTAALQLQNSDNTTVYPIISSVANTHFTIFVKKGSVYSAYNVGGNAATFTFYPLV